MYNETQKIKFIEGLNVSQATKKIFYYLFRSFEPYEEEWGADLCTQPLNELQRAINATFGSSYSSKKSRLSFLRKYIQWCIDNDVPNTSLAVYEVSITENDSLRTKSVRSPLHLQAFLDTICDPESEQTISCVYRCFYWLAFMGISEENAIELSSDNVDLINMVVVCGGQECPIYRESIPAFRNCVRLESFKYKHPNYTSIISRPRVAGSQLLRGVKSHPKILQLRREMTHRNKVAIKEGRTTLELSFGRVFRSGFFYRIHERELAGYPVDFTNIAKTEVADKIKSGEIDKQYVTQNVSLIKNNYIKTYEEWKRTLV